MIVRGLMNKKYVVHTDVTVFVIFLWQLTTSNFTGPSIYWAVKLGKYEAPAESLC